MFFREVSGEMTCTTEHAPSSDSRATLGDEPDDPDDDDDERRLALEAPSVNESFPWARRLQAIAPRPQRHLKTKHFLFS